MTGCANGERFRVLVEGTLALWRVDAHACFDAGASRCRIVRDGHTLAVVEHVDSPIGAVWRIESAGRLPRTHRSVAPALATLRDVVCPQRPGGRALFVAAPVDGAAPRS